MKPHKKTNPPSQISRAILSEKFPRVVESGGWLYRFITREDGLHGPRAVYGLVALQNEGIVRLAQ